VRIGAAVETRFLNDCVWSLNIESRHGAKSALAKAIVLIGLLVASLCVFSSLVAPVGADLDDGGDVEDKFRSTIEGWVALIQSNVLWISEAMTGLVRGVIKAVYFIVGLAGFLMWSSGVSKYSGKRLVLGAVAMAFVSEVLL
jgi:uncharacterized membrane protein YuzA (DUF378 family)